MILSKYPTHEVANNALLGLQEELQKTGNADEFEEYMTIFRNANPGSNQLESIEFEAAKSHYFNQNYDQAINALELFLASYPNSAQGTEANYLIADAFFRIDNNERALTYYYKISNDLNFNR